MYTPSLKTSLSDWVLAHLLWATCCDPNLLIGNINLCSVVPLLPTTLLPLTLFPLSLLLPPHAALTWRQNKTERWVIGKQISRNPPMQAAFPCYNNVEPIHVPLTRAVHCCNKPPLGVEQRSTASCPSFIITVFLTSAPAPFLSLLCGCVNFLFWWSWRACTPVIWKRWLPFPLRRQVNEPSDLHYLVHSLVLLAAP